LRQSVPRRNVLEANGARIIRGRSARDGDARCKADASLAYVVVIAIGYKLDPAHGIINAPHHPASPVAGDVRDWPDRAVASSTMAEPPITVATRHVNAARPASADHSAAFYFDCESTGVTDDSCLTCAAVTGGGLHAYVWHSGQGEPLSVSAGNKLVDFLVACGPERVYTFNGGAFDLRMLYRLTGRPELKTFAMQHRDLMLVFVCENRYYSSMQSFASATLGPSQSKTNTGAWAATAWSTEEASAVLDYCVEDTVVLGRLIEHARTWGKLRRVAKSGKTMTWTLGSLDGTIPTVQAALASPADASWMTEPPALPDLRWATATCRPNSA